MKIPAGYKLVPIDPTPEMIEAGESVEDLYRRGTPETWGKVFRAMTNAAPHVELDQSALVHQIELLRGALLRCQTKIFIDLKSEGWTDEEARSMFEMVLAKEALDASADWRTIELPVPPTEPYMSVHSRARKILGFPAKPGSEGQAE